jgi:hypothetical protein
LIFRRFTEKKQVIHRHQNADHAKRDGNTKNGQYAAPAAA